MGYTILTLFLFATFTILGVAPGATLTSGSLKNRFCKVFLRWLARRVPNLGSALLREICESFEYVSARYHVLDRNFVEFSAATTLRTSPGQRLYGLVLGLRPSLLTLTAVTNDDNWSGQNTRLYSCWNLPSPVGEISNTRLILFLGPETSIAPILKCKRLFLVSANFGLAAQLTLLRLCLKKGICSVDLAWIRDPADSSHQESLEYLDYLLRDLIANRKEVRLSYYQSEVQFRQWVKQRTNSTLWNDEANYVITSDVHWLEGMINRQVITMNCKETS